jgi:phospholipid-binding lipoprotein MlaA
MKTTTLRIAVIVLSASLAVLTGCAASRPQEGAEPAQRQLADVMDPNDTSMVASTYDPWEGYNRWMYNFNARFDRYIFAPTAEVYKRYLPQFLRSSVHNFMRNIREVLNVYNALLQFRFRTAGRSTGRFLVNSTVGMAGLLDPATEMGLYYQKEDFGQTLGVWGVGPGPYFVLPIFGPSTLRDATGLGVDYAAWYYLDLFGYRSWASDQPLVWPNLLYAIDLRASVAFRYYEMGSIYEYLWVRQLFLEFREFEIAR